METSKSTQPLASTQIRELAPGIHNSLPALTADARILSIPPRHINTTAAGKLMEHFVLVPTQQMSAIMCMDL